MFIWPRWQSRLFYMHDHRGLYDLKWKVPMPVWLHRSYRLLCPLRMGTLRGVPMLLCKQGEGCDIQHVHNKTRVPQGFGYKRNCRILQSLNKEINNIILFFFQSVYIHPLFYIFYTKLALISEFTVFWGGGTGMNSYLLLSRHGT